MGRQVRRVPLDFNHPVGETWPGFVNPHHVATKCTACDGSGYSQRAKELKDRWYGYVPFDPRETGSKPFTPSSVFISDLARRNVMQSVVVYASDRDIDKESERLCRHFNRLWSHHLSQADVDALVEANRLFDFTHTWTQGIGWKPKDPPYHPTAAEVNEWSLRGFGHDSINCHVCIEAACKREGVSPTCAECEGHGEIWPSVEAKAVYEAWETTEPPTGDAYQLWETVSEGSPISQPFATPEELADWLTTPGNGWWEADRDTTREQWLAFIRGPGWAPSLFESEKTGVVSGVVAMVESRGGISA